MRIAYLITAYNDYRHLQRLVAALDGEGVRFYIHIDRKSPLPDTLGGFANITLIDRVVVWWGGFSHLQAIVNLLRRALRDDNDRFVLLSGADYPIRSNQSLHEYLARGREHINVFKGFRDHKPESRMRDYHFDGYDRRAPRQLRTRCYQKLEALLRACGVRKRAYPFRGIYHGSTWWALTRACAGYVCEYLDNNPDCLAFYRSCWCPEETLFQSIVGNSPFLGNVEPALTYVNWDADPAPGLITAAHVRLFRDRLTLEDENYGMITPFFARKFNDASTEVVALIDAELRSSGPLPDRTPAIRP